MKKYLMHPFTMSLGISAFVLALILMTDIPLGIPSDWIWSRLEHPGIPHVELSLIAVFLLLGASVAFYVDFHIPLHKKRAKLSGVLLVCTLGLLFDYHVLLCGRASIAENVVAVADKWSTGYLTQAAQVDNLNDFVSGYCHVLAKDQERSNHTDVHPPGNTLYSLLAITLVQPPHSPAKYLTTRLVSAWDMTNTTELMREGGCYAGVTIVDFDDFTHAAILVVLSFVLFVAAAKLILIIALVGCTKDYNHVGLCSLFLWSIPAPILFLGSYDTLYYFLSSVLCLLLSLWFNNRNRYVMFAIGVLLGAYICFSIGFACIIFLVTVILLLCAGCRVANATTLIAPLLLGGMAAMVVYYLCRMDIMEACWLCTRNSARFFAEANRSSWWIVVNYLDYFLFVGSLPIVMLCYFCGKGLKAKSTDRSFPEVVSLACAVTVVVLFVSPACRGEMGRLILLLIPFNVLVACIGLQKLCNKSTAHYVVAIGVIGVSVLQLLVLRTCVSTVLLF